MYKLFDNGDCATEITGTGVLSCDQIERGDLIGASLVKKGYKKPITDGVINISDTVYIEDTKKLELFPLRGLYDFSQDTPENEKNTSPLGVVRFVRSGKPQFKLMYDKGTCFHKALYNKKGQERWDVILIFEKGIAMAHNSKVTELKGFDGGMFDVETFKIKQGTDTDMSTAHLQLLDTDEFNERFVFIPYSKIGDVDKVDGVVETAIKLTASAGTSIEASITSGCNTGDSILDLEEVTNFVLLGTQASATTISAVSYNANTNKYVFTLDTPLVATDTVQIQLNDGTYKVVEDTVGNLYKGTSNLVTVS